MEKLDCVGGLFQTLPPRGYQIDGASFLYPQGNGDDFICWNGKPGKSKGSGDLRMG
jgi:hypothetical protein